MSGSRPPASLRGCSSRLCCGPRCSFVCRLRYLDYLNPARPAAPRAGEGFPGRCWAEPELQQAE